MLYPSELRAHSRHYRRFSGLFGLDDVFDAVRSILEMGMFRMARLIFWRAFLMFLSPVALSHGRSIKVLDGRS